MARRYYSKVTRKGQVTVPADVRREMNIEVGDRISFLVEDGKLQIEPAGGWTQRTAGIFKSDAPPMTAEELRAAAEIAIAEDVMERHEHGK